MEPKGSLLCSQEPSTSPYHEPSKIYFNIIHLGLPFGFPINILYACLDLLNVQKILSLGVETNALMFPQFTP
jgi:hypothetical protein